MNVTQVQMQNFMRHDSFSLVLPETGTVLVTGINGCGKSTIMESVAWCCWGRTLRGSKPWREGQVCSVTVTTPNLTITRQRSKGGTNKLLWKYTDATATDFDTATKGQAALDKVIGAFDVWRKTHVLTNADAAQFTEATDSERKRLLEEVLGIDKIDAAKERARLDAAGAEIALDRVTTSVAQRAITLKTTAQTLLALPVAVADPPPAVDAKALAAMVRAAKAARQASNDREKSVYDGVRAKRGTLQELRRRLDRLGVSECPVCSQAITDALRAPLEAQVLAEDAAVQALQAQAEIEAALVHDECAEADEEYIALAANEKTLAQQLALHAQQAKLVKESAAQRARLQVIISTCEKELASAKELLPTQQRRVACLKAVQIAFGMKGFRAQLLSDAILGVEAFTNTWLQIIAPDLSVKLSLGEKHEVKLDLIGAGGGFGYQALSSGERRRIDVAVVLALADMASQATGIGAGTLWLDEVFDSLDPVGTQGVCEALLVLSESRVAVVITHSDELRSQVDTQMSITL